MNPKFITENGWTEAIIDDDCTTSKFYLLANLMMNRFNLNFTEQLNDLDAFYWDFEYKNIKLVLHYNIYLGISIYPFSHKSANKVENDAVKEIANLLVKQLNEQAETLIYPVNNGKY